MSAMSLLAGALVAGVLLGAFFFGGLWWTVRHGVVAGNPALWFGLSGLVRMGLVAAGLYCVAHRGSPSLLICLLGFLIARVAVTRLTRAAHPQRTAG